MDFGPWTMNVGLWTMDFGLWTIDMKIEEFENIEAWKKGRELAKDIYAATGKGEFARDYVQCQGATPTRPRK